MKKILLLTTILISTYVLFFHTTTRVKADAQSFTIEANSGNIRTNQGNFQPASITVNQGDEVNISFTVPEDDIYCCGVQIKSNGGEFDTGLIKPGETKSVNFIAGSSFVFTSYWPDTGAVKATGSVNVVNESGTLPDQPSNLIGDSISTSQIQLKWASSQGATAYKVFKNDNLVATVSTVFYDDNGLESDTTYLYKVQATDGTLDSDLSEEISVTTRTAVDSPNIIEEGEGEENTEPTPIPTGGVDVELQSDFFIDQTQRYVMVDKITWGYAELPEVEKGDSFTVFGSTIALANIEIVILPENLAFTTQSDEDGHWEISIDSLEFRAGQHTLSILVTADDMDGRSQDGLLFFVPGEGLINPNLTSYPTSYSLEEEDSESILWIVIILAGILFFLIGLILSVKHFFLTNKPKKQHKGDTSKDDSFTLKPVAQLDSLLRDESEQDH